MTYGDQGIGMNFKAFAVAAGLAAAVAGCSEYAGPKENSGAVIGGVAGGLIGNTIGHGQGRAAATILGAALGAVVGGAVGRNLDDVDRQRAYYAAQRSFETGRRQYWENPRTGHRGEFVPRRSYHNDEDEMCRDFEHTIWVRGEPEVIEGTACEMADGSWRVVG